MKIRIFFLFFVFLPLHTFSQDLIILKTGKRLYCKISKIDSTNVYYNLAQSTIESSVNKKDIMNYQCYSKGIDVKIDNDTLSKSDTSATSYSKGNGWTSIVTVSGFFGLHADGGALLYYGFNTPEVNKWALAAMAGIEIFTIKSSYFANSGYYSASLTYWLPGLAAFRRLNNFVYLNLGSQIPIGYEELNGGAESNFVIGLAPFQGIWLIPKSKYGLTLAFSVYEKILTSKVYKDDLGFIVELGFKF
jgi:hypothetical protein